MGAVVSTAGVLGVVLVAHFLIFFKCGNVDWSAGYDVSLAARGL